MRRALTIAALLAASAAGAQEPALRYDPRTAADKTTFVLLYARTSHCMRQASVAMLRQGVRQPETIRAFSVGTCGKTLRGWLVTRDGFTEAQAATTLDHMARRAIDAAQQPPDFIIL